MSSASVSQGSNIFSNSDDRNYTPAILPSLEVVKTIPKMESGINIDWLLHIYYARRDFARCKILIGRELLRQLNPEYLYFVKGLIDREEDNNIEALRNLQKALDFNPQNIETYKEIGKTLFLMGRYEKALSAFREAEKELAPRVDNEIYHYIGELLLRAATTMASTDGVDPIVAMKDKSLPKRTPPAKGGSNKILPSIDERTAENKSAEDNVNVSNAGVDKRADVMPQKQQEAKLYFQKAVQHGKKLESFQRLAEIYRMEHEFGRAIEVLENALLLFPDNVDLLTEIGVLYLKLNDTQKAFDRLQEVVNNEKAIPRGLLAFGAILQARNDVDGALSKYREIAAIDSENAELWNNIGLCFFKKQKFIAAISSLRKAIWISPANYNALYNLSLVYIRVEQYASAFHTLAAAINLRKEDNAECYMLLGLCLRKLDDTENAFNAFQRSSTMALATSAATSGATRNPLVHLNFALFCYETGRFTLANEEYNRFVVDSKDMLLPTEYKFQATKLKSLLKISSKHILTDDEAIESVAATTDDIVQPDAGHNYSTTSEKINDENMVGCLNDEILLGWNNANASGIDDIVNEIPLEVNAVVNSLGLATTDAGAGNTPMVSAITGGSAHLHPHSDPNMP